MHKCGYISNGICYQWSVDKLISASEKLTAFDFNVDSVDLKNCFWFQKIPNVEEILLHIKQINRADISFPIILAPDGTILDGIHRIVKARSLNLKIIKAVQFKELPEPDSKKDVGDQKNLTS